MRKDHNSRNKKSTPKGNTSRKKSDQEKKGDGKKRSSSFFSEDKPTKRFSGKAKPDFENKKKGNSGLKKSTKSSPFSVDDKKTSGDRFKKPFKPSFTEDKPKRSLGNKQRAGGKFTKTFKKKSSPTQPKPIPSAAEDGTVRLNRYIANAGICSRREADKLIAEGLIKVNGKTITELGHKVNIGDEVRYDNRVLKREKTVYILLNKPKDYITTTDDPQERRTVMSLIEGACKERVYPVGRLDRNTTGLLLLTNDGYVAEKLMHPSHKIHKIYQAELDKPLSKVDFDKILEGLRLEDGLVKVDDLAYVENNKKIIGIEIHVGKNRIVRRIFEHLGYEVVKLDRTVYAGLTKKDLPRGMWRFLTEKEIAKLG